MQYVSSFEGPDWTRHAGDHIYALRELGFSVDKTISSLECGNIPGCVKRAIKYGIGNGLEFHPDDSPFKDVVWDALSEGLAIGYEIILEPTCVVAERSNALPEESSDIVVGNLYRHLQLNKAFNEIKKAIPNLGGHAGVSVKDEPALAITNLLMYAATVQHNSGITFCKKA